MKPLTSPSVFKIAGSLLGITFMLCTSHTHAANRDPAANAKLEAISRQLASEDNANFILVEALKDNLIEEGKPYNFAYTTEFVRINDEDLQEPLLSKYLKLMQDFVAHNPKKNKVGYLSIRGDIFKVDAISHPQSPSPHSAKSAEPKPNVVEKAFYPNTIINEMVADGLTDTTRKVHISYTDKGLFVDDQALSPELDAKYKARFKELSSFTPSGKGGGIDIVSTPDNPKEAVAAALKTELPKPAALTGRLQNIKASGASDLDNVHIYPNPATDHITIEGAKGGLATITNVVGQQVATVSVAVTEARQNIDIQRLPAGNYILQITTATGSRGAINISKQ